MTDHIITGKQMQSIIAMFWLGSLVVIGASKEAKQDYWISILVSAIMILPLIFLYVRLIRLYPGLNLFEILFQIFGKIFGRVISILFVFFAIHLGSMVMCVFSSFIHIVNMPETPDIIISAMILVISVMSVKNGPENIGRVAKYTWVLLAVFVPFTFVVGIKNMQFSNLLPVLSVDFKSILGSAYTMFTLPLGEAILCLSFFSAVDKKENPYKVYIKALVVAIIIILIVALRNLLILGPTSVTLFEYPSYEAVSIISIGEFFTRIEVLIGINLMLAGFIKFCVCLYTASLGLAKVLNVPDQKLLVVPCALIILTLSTLLYKNIQDMMGWIKYFSIYAIPFEVILPVVTLIGAEIQNKMKSGGSSKPKGSENGNEPAS